MAATCIAIFLIPVTFALFERLSLRFSHKQKPLLAKAEQNGENL